MSVYVVTWNLNKEKSNYSTARSEFINQLNHFDNKQDSGLESVRFVSTTSTVEQVYAYLRLKTDDNDRLFVSLMHRGCHLGWLDKDVWEWINTRL